MYGETRSERQERLIEEFLANKNSGSLSIPLYSREVKKLKNIYKNLTFTKTYKFDNSKEYNYRIERK